MMDNQLNFDKDGYLNQNIGFSEDNESQRHEERLLFRQEPNIVLPQLPLQDQLWVVLNAWGLPHLYTVLTRYKIKFEALKYVKTTDINVVFKSEDDLGDKILFRGKLDDWRKENNLPPLEDECTNCKTVTDSSRQPDISAWLQTSSNYEFAPEKTSSKCEFDFSKFMKSAAGEKLLKIYNEQNPPKLTIEGRHYLIDSIIKDYMDKDTCMEVEDFRKITKHITETFPSEEGEYYFKPASENQRCSSGSLYNKYRNSASRLRSRGIFTSRKRRNSSKSSDRSTIRSPEFTFEEDFPSNKNWLSCFYEPRDTVEIKWTATSKGRRYEFDAIESSGGKIKNFLQDWPLYTSANGFRLVEIDFNIIYPEKSTLLMSKWNDFAEKAQSILQKHIKDNKIRKDIPKLQNIINTDEKNLKLLKLIHYALPPTSRISKKDNEKQFWKPSIGDSISSFVLEVASHNVIDAKLEEIKNKYVEYSLNLQPLILVVGEEGSEKEFVTVFDGILYKFQHFLSAVDCCFKLFFVFNVKYPIESNKVWLFIQQYFYQISTNYDQSDAKLIILLSELRSSM